MILLPPLDIIIGYVKQLNKMRYNITYRDIYRNANKN